MRFPLDFHLSVGNSSDFLEVGPGFLRISQIQTESAGLNDSNFKSQILRNDTGVDGANSASTANFQNSSNKCSDFFIMGFGWPNVWKTSLDYWLSSENSVETQTRFRKNFPRNFLECGNTGGRQLCVRKRHKRRNPKWWMSTNYSTPRTNAWRWKRWRKRQDGEQWWWRNHDLTSEPRGIFGIIQCDMRCNTKEALV